MAAQDYRRLRERGALYCRGFAVGMKALLVGDRRHDDRRGHGVPEQRDGQVEIRLSIAGRRMPTPILETITAPSAGYSAGAMTPQADVRSTAALLAGALCVMSFWASAQQAPGPTVAPLPRILKDYKEVTSARLTSPESHNWLQVRGTYNGWGYSPLTRITPANVKQLQLTWVFSTGATSAHEAAPLVNEGVMYVAAPGNQVIAIDAKAGTRL